MSQEKFHGLKPQVWRDINDILNKAFPSQEGQTTKSKQPGDLRNTFAERQNTIVPSDKSDYKPLQIPQIDGLEKIEEDEKFGNRYLKEKQRLFTLRRGIIDPHFITIGTFRYSSLNVESESRVPFTVDTLYEIAYDTIPQLLYKKEQIPRETELRRSSTVRVSYGDKGELGKEFRLIDPRQRDLFELTLGSENVKNVKLDVINSSIGNYAFEMDYRLKLPRPSIGLYIPYTKQWNEQTVKWLLENHHQAYRRETIKNMEVPVTKAMNTIIAMVR